VQSEKRIRTLLQDLDGDALDVIIGGWLRVLAAAGKPARPQDAPPEHVAVDGKWLRGAGDGQVRLFFALQRGDGVIIAQHRISAVAEPASADSRSPAGWSRRSLMRSAIWRGPARWAAVTSEAVCPPVDAISGPCLPGQ
jgi:hypothetical protein